ncbi:NAD(P)-binding protein [Neobacillus sp. 114]|uniref:NAD(P)-binding protein n=1 Tax=Neobacillus sp. 114 TaxID=3048535 RepID=UPI0024C38355|nr:NAD(P)-binding protein [Neobacillus sp. 114]
MNGYYPIMLKLEGKKVVVAGGGKVAERKVKGLLETGAAITVISPESTPVIQHLAHEGKITWKQKSFAKLDIQEAFLIIAATNDPHTNNLVKEEAAAHQLVSIADNPEESDFHLPSHLKRGRLSIAVSTGGASPILAKQIRKQLEQQFDSRYENYLEFLFSKRKWILKNVEDADLKRKLLTVIVSPEFLNSGDWDEMFQRLYEQMI